VRIAVLSRNFSSAGGGAERYSVALVAQLASEHDVHVFAQRTEQPVAGVTYHAIPMPFRRPRWINQLWFAYATWRQTRRGFDLVHSHENSWHGDVQTVHVLPVRHTLFAGRSGIALALRWLKVVFSLRQLAYLALEAARFHPQPQRRIVVTSPALRDVMLAAYPDCKNMLEVVTPGTDAPPDAPDAGQKAAARHALNLPANGWGILFVGNDFRRKGLQTLLDALCMQRQSVPDCWLAVVGHGRHDKVFQQLVITLGLQDCVYFVGSLSNMHVAYQAADCLAHPTLEDSYAMVVLEAMAHSLPVVVSGMPYCGISAELTSGVQALLLQDPHDAPALGIALQAIARDPELRTRLSKAGLAFAKLHTWNSVAAKYVSIYESLAPERRKRWLVLSHAFNMDGRAASQTITDKMPHLEKAGIELVVLSGVSGRRDTHYRHYQLWPAGPAGFRFELRHVLRRHYGYGFGYRFRMLLLTLVLLPLMLLEKWWRPIESSWSWWLSAYVKGRVLLKKQHFDLIYSTGGAFSAHIAGAALKRVSGVPWLAEIHDPLVEPGSTPQSAQQKMQARIESLICAHADIAVWFTEQALVSAKQRNPVLGSRGHTMLPGVDAPAVDLAPYVPTARFVVGHYGSLSPTRNLEMVMDALDSLLEIQPALRGTVELHIYGGLLDPISAGAKRRVTHDFIRHFGRIENDPVSGKSGRDQILQRMRNTDLLLLLHGVEPICAEYIPSKLYEYLWMKRPILALIYQSPQLEKIVANAGHHALRLDKLTPAQTREALQRLLNDFVARWRNHDLRDVQTANALTTENSVANLLQFVEQGLTTVRSEP